MNNKGRNLSFYFNHWVSKKSQEKKGSHFVLNAALNLWPLTEITFLLSKKYSCGNKEEIKNENNSNESAEETLFIFYFLTFSFASAIISLLIVNVHVKKSLFSTSTWFHTLWPSAALTGHNRWPPQHQKLCLVSSNTYSSWVLRHRDSQEVKRRFLTRWKFLRALLDCLWMYSDQLGKKISWDEDNRSARLMKCIYWTVDI